MRRQVSGFEVFLYVLCMTFCVAIVIALDQIKIGVDNTGCGTLVLSSLGYINLSAMCRKIATHEWRTK